MDFSSGIQLWKVILELQYYFCMSKNLLQYWSIHGFDKKKLKMICIC